jgi:NAD(P)-dependent dehydrogenase (short-subunit alcohol dehydrogenase family)
VRRSRRLNSVADRAISILVNNAGIIRRGTAAAASTRQDWDATLAVNLDGPYNMVTAFLDQLRETKGSVINLGSIQSFVALPNSAAYTTSKGGVRLLTKALATELGPYGYSRQRDRARVYRDPAERNSARGRRLHI